MSIRVTKCHGYGENTSPVSQLIVVGSAMSRVSDFIYDRPGIVSFTRLVGGWHILDRLVWDLDTLLMVLLPVQGLRDRNGRDPGRNPVSRHSLYPRERTVGRRRRMFTSVK